MSYLNQHGDLSDEKMRRALDKSSAYIKNFFGPPDFVCRVVRAENPDLPGPPIWCYGLYLLFMDEADRVYKVTKTFGHPSPASKGYQIIAHRGNPLLRCR